MFLVWACCSVTAVAVPGAYCVAGLPGDDGVLLPVQQYVWCTHPRVNSSMIHTTRNKFVLRKLHENSRIVCDSGGGVGWLFSSFRRSFLPPALYRKIGAGSTTTTAQQYTAVRKAVRCVLVLSVWHNLYYSVRYVVLPLIDCVHIIVIAKALRWRACRLQLHFSFLHRSSKSNRSLAVSNLNFRKFFAHPCEFADGMCVMFLTSFNRISSIYRCSGITTAAVILLRKYSKLDQL